MAEKLHLLQDYVIVSANYPVGFNTLGYKVIITHIIAGVFDTFSDTIVELKDYFDRLRRS